MAKRTEFSRLNLKVLDLSLCYKWFDMIASGEKKEEYREIKDYWTKRFIQNHVCVRKFREFEHSKIVYRNALRYFPRHYDAVRFHRGQGGKQTMLIECKGISVGYGNPAWGAPADREVYIIKLGQRLDN